MELIKWYFIIGTIIAVLFEMVLWYLNDDLDKRTKRYYKKFGGFIYVFTWPCIFYVIFENLIKKDES
jgi:hypothetical protein